MKENIIGREQEIGMPSPHQRNSQGAGHRRKHQHTLFMVLPTYRQSHGRRGG